MADLKALAAAAQGRAGRRIGEVESIRKQAASLGWDEVAPRRGDATVLRAPPCGRDAAHPNSLSAVYGLGQQPLHTDGAHMPDRPTFSCSSPSIPARPRRGLAAGMPVRSGGTPPAPGRFCHGMFLVRNGRDSFYAPALVRGRGYRYDPGCMTPCDARAREVERVL